MSRPYYLIKENEYKGKNRYFLFMKSKHGERARITYSSLLLKAKEITPRAEQASWFVPESFTLIWLGCAAVKWALCIIYFSGQIGFLFSEPIWLLQRHQHVLYSTLLNSLSLQLCCIKHCLDINQNPCIDCLCLWIRTSCDVFLHHSLLI